MQKYKNILITETYFQKKHYLCITFYSHTIIFTNQIMKELLNLIIPRGKTEKIIFFSTLIWFLCFSLFFALTVDFSYHHELMGYDSDFYIGGETHKVMLNKIISWNLRHPLYVMINYPILLIDTLLPSTLHWAVFAVFSSIMMAGSNLFIYKVCKISLVGESATLTSVILFPTFAHIMLLSSLAETYVLTIYFVLLLILLALTKKSTSLSDNIIFAILTGTTLTNCIYFFFIKIWEKSGQFWQAVLTTLKSTYLFIPLFGVTFIGLAFRYFFKHIPLMEAILNDTHKFVHDNNIQFTIIWNHYFADPFLFHYTDQVVHTSNAEVLPAYPSLFYHISIIFLLLFALWGVVKAKAILRNICLSFFAYNIIIHFICGYGNNELQLFCGHWLFFVPLFLAVGLSTIRQTLIRRFFQFLILTCAVFFAIHNAYCYITSIQACSL